MASTIETIEPSGCLTDFQIASLSRFIIQTTAKYDSLQQRAQYMAVSDTGDIVAKPPIGYGTTRPTRCLNIQNALLKACITDNQDMAMSITLVPGCIIVTIAETGKRPDGEMKDRVLWIWEKMQGIQKVVRCTERENAEAHIKNTHQLIATQMVNNQDGDASSESNEVVAAENGDMPDVVMEDMSPNTDDIEKDQGQGPELEQDPSEPEAPEVDPFSSQPFRTQFFREVHDRCYLKLRRRVQRYLNGIDEFYMYYLYEADIDEVDPEGFLYDILEPLVMIKKIVMANINARDSSGFQGSQWDTLMKWLQALADRYRWSEYEIKRLIDGIIRAWNGLQARKNPNNPLHHFNLWRAIQKMIELSSYIHQLVDFACKARNRHLLERSIEVVLLNPIVVSTPEPSDKDMETIVECAFDDTWTAYDNPTMETIDWHLDNQNLHIDVALSGTVPFINVHAEQVLLLYHHRRSKKYRSNIGFVPPLQCIATSSLPCACCWSTYNNYSEATGRIFKLFGQDPKVTSPWWAASNLFEPRLAAVVKWGVYDELVGLYRKHLREMDGAAGEEVVKVLGRAPANPMAIIMEIIERGTMGMVVFPVVAGMRGLVRAARAALRRFSKTRGWFRQRMVE